MKADQYLLEIKAAPSFRESDYVASQSNHQALTFIKAWPHWGNARLSNVGYIYGPRGSGKSHLGSIWQSFASAAIVTSELVASRNFLSTNYLLDGLENFLPDHELGLMHLCNHVIDAKQFLLITARQPAIRLGVKLPDLASRLQGLSAIKIEEPDDQMVEALVIKYFSDSRILVSQPVIKYLMARIDRSYEAMADVLQALDKISLIEKRRISIPLIKAVLNDPSGDDHQ